MILWFSAAQELCSKLQNQAKCDLAVLEQMRWKFIFTYTFDCSKRLLQLEPTIIAWLVIVPSLL